jgi:cellulose synthase/poly-beta-1,6-N-acetylglucosamine synthase-like glycosyltransferase
LITATGEFIVIFDADFVPAPDFLKKILPHFDGERIAFVQARWGHLNRSYSFFTFLQSLSIDAHFAVEQLARSYLGFWFNFNGTAGVWRKEAILDAGGWKAETLTEDLDLSYRAFLRGWSARYASSTVGRAAVSNAPSATCR